MAFDKAHIIELPKICDPRGNMSVIESWQQVPFGIKRAYWIYDVPGGMFRNGHAFKTQQEMIVALSGSFDVALNDGAGERRYHMARSYYGLYVPPMTWRKIDNFSTNSVVLVLSDELYDASDYIEDSEQFVEKLKTYRPAAKKAHKLSDSSLLETIPFASSSVEKCRIIELERHHHANGNLSVVESCTDVPFSLARAFYLYDIPGGENRGGHAHRELYQLIVAMSGAFDVTVSDGAREHRFMLNRPYQALLVPPGIWNNLSNFSSGAVCAVLCSAGYDEDDYVRDYAEFKALTAVKRVNRQPS